MGRDDDGKAADDASTIGSSGDSNTRTDDGDSPLSFEPRSSIRMNNINQLTPDRKPCVDERSARTEAAGAMAIIAVHEIGNVVGWVDLALAMAEHATRSSRETRTGANVDLGATIRDARMGVRHITDIVHALQGLERSRETETELFDPVEALRIAIRFAEQRISAHASLVEDICSTPMLRGRKHELTCVFLNLLHNALDALSGGTPETDTITVIAKATDGNACFEVHDTGVGIPAEVAERVFDPYFSGSPDSGGMGIGLHVCRRIVREMGGEIGFESSQGVGTRFRVLLPGAASAPPTPAA